MDVDHLLVGIRVEFVELLPRWRSQGFLKITVYAPPTGLCPLGNSIFSVHRLRSFACFVFLIESVQSAGEAGGDSMLVV